MLRKSVSIFCALFVFVATVALGAPQTALAQDGPDVVTNVVDGQVYGGPQDAELRRDVVLSGEARSPEGISSVRLIVRNIDTGEWVQDSDGTLGPSALSLTTFNAKLPPLGDPGITWRLPLLLVDGSYTALITATDSLGEVSSLGPLAFTVGGVGVVQDQELIAAGADWSYFDLGSEPETDAAGEEWTAPGFDDSAWVAGPAELGYGTATAVTTTAAEDADGNELITTYFRHDFTAGDLDDYEEVEITVYRDDGAVLYLNGDQIFKTNMPNGQIKYSTTASFTSSGLATVVIPTSDLLAGDNTIAVEVHQSTTADADMAFWLSAVAKADPVATLPIESDARPGTYLLTAGDMIQCTNQLFPGRGSAEIAGEMDKLFAQDAGVFLGLGDLAYGSGTIDEFNNCYDPTAGRHKDVTWPSPGNHEHRDTPNAEGYRLYFGPSAGPLAGPNGGLWYSFDIDDDWHVIALDSDCQNGFEPLPGAIDGDGCARGSEQEQWLRADLAANADKNIIAFFHHPPYTKNHYNNHEYTWPLRHALAEFGTDITLHGHEHHYERYTPMDYWGDPDTTYGMREFIIGSGGRDPRYNVQSPDPRSDFKGTFPFGTFDYGLLQLWLQPDGYEWKWEPLFGNAETDTGTSGLAQAMPLADLSGTVTVNHSGDPLADVEVCATAFRTGYETCTTSDAFGDWSIPAVVSDDYTIVMVDPIGDHQGVEDTVTHDAPTNTVVDVGLIRYRSIAGTVLADDDNSAIEGAVVCADPAPAVGESCATADADGDYLLAKFLPGDYRIEFTGTGYLPECYDDAIPCDDATLVTVEESSDVINIDASLGTVTGDVNCDGVFDIRDAAWATQHAVLNRTDAGSCDFDPSSELYAAAGDTDSDGQLTINDARVLQLCAVQLPQPFCPVP